MLDHFEKIKFNQIFVKKNSLSEKKLQLMNESINLVNLE